MEATRSSETSVYNKSTRRHIPDNGILHGENLNKILKVHNAFIISLVAHYVSRNNLSFLRTGPPPPTEIRTRDLPCQQFHELPTEQSDCARWPLAESGLITIPAA
jgi:hypothetical protein